MKVHFKNQSFDIYDAGDLHKVAPEYKNLTDFIKNWIDGCQHFTFQSSGSTGKPKKIQVTRDQILASVEGTRLALGLKTEDKVLLCLNPDYIASIMMAARAMVVGMDIFIQPASSSPLSDWNQPVDFASFVPLQIYEMIRLEQLDQLSQIRNVLIGGAPLNQEAMEALSTLKNNIYLSYGMTETVSHIALMKISGRQPSDTYRCLPGIEIGTHQDDCLKIKGAVTNDQWLLTTDVVEIISSNEFKWMGRADHVINSGGVKIHPEQLEKALTSELDGLDFFIDGLPDDKLGRVCCLFSTSEIPMEQFEKVQKVIQEKFSKHHIPRKSLLIPRLIKTESGKLNRKETLKQISQ